MKVKQKNKMSQRTSEWCAFSSKTVSLSLLPWRWSYKKTPWRVLPSVFLIFQKLTMFSLWLQIHYSFRAAQVMQCFYDFDHPLKPKSILCKCLTQVRKIVTTTKVLSHTHTHTVILHDINLDSITLLSLPVPVVAPMQSSKSESVVEDRKNGTFVCN